MDFKSCIAKRTRAQEDLYLLKLCEKMKWERGEIPKSKNSEKKGRPEMRKNLNMETGEVSKSNKNHVQSKKRGRNSSATANSDFGIRDQHKTFSLKKFKNCDFKSPDHPLKEGTLSQTKSTRRRARNSSEAIKLGFRGRCSLFQNENVESDEGGHEEACSKSKQGLYDADDIIDVDNLSSDDDYEVEESDGSVFDGDYNNLENEVETNGNGDKEIGSDPKTESKSGHGCHEPEEVIDVDKIQFDEPEINDKSPSHNAFSQGCHEPDEVIHVDALGSDESDSDTSDENGISNNNNDVNKEIEVEENDNKTRSKSKEIFNEGDDAANAEKMASKVSKPWAPFVDSDESLSSSDTNNDDSDDMDYEMEQSYSSNSKDSSSSEGSDDESYLSEETDGEEIDSIGSVSKKADLDSKKKSKSKVGGGEGYVAAKAKKVAYKVCKHLSVDSDENDQPEKTGDEKIDSVDSQNIMAGFDANKMKSKSKSGFGEVDVAATPTKEASKVRRQVSIVEPEASLSSSDGSKGDSDDSDFEVEKSNFLVEASKPNAFKSKGADKNNHHEETEFKNIHSHSKKLNSHFIELKICGSKRHFETSLGNTCGGATIGGDQVKSFGRETVRNGVEVDDGIHLCTSNRTQLKKIFTENPPKVNEEDDETREEPTKRRQGGYDIFRILADSILGEVLLEGEPCEQQAKQSCSLENTLNYKFRFEDEDPAPVEKLELEIEVEALFEEMDFALKCEEMGFFEPPTVESENSKNPVADKNQSTLCCKGKHQPILDEEIGIICQCCYRVLCEVKYVMPEWATSTSRVSERKNFYGDNGNSIFDGLQFKASGDDAGNSSNHAEGTVWDITPGTKESLYQHQQEGFEFLWKNLSGTINLADLKSAEMDEVGGCIISHAPGTGKTRLTAVFIESYLKLFPSCRPVIIAPASMLLTWEEEFRKWKIEFPFHNLNNMELSGKENMVALKLLKQNNKSLDMKAVRMVKLFSWNKGNSILGVSYNLYEKLAGEKFVKENGSKKRKKVVLDKENEEVRKILLEFPGLVVFDEGHTPRNGRSSIWNTLLNLQTKKRVILSGTPFQNNFGELSNTLCLVRPAIANVLSKERTFGDFTQSRRKYSRRNGAAAFNSSKKVSDDSIEKLKETIAPFVHVHKGTILQQSLPGLRDSVVLLNPPPLQKHLINAIESQNTFEFEHKVALISIHPSLIQHCTLSDKEKSIVEKEALEEIRLEPDKGVKTRFLVELIRLSLAKKEKVLIFSQYVHPLEFLKDQLAEIFGWDENQILQMQGGLEQKLRQNLISRFNDQNNEAKVLLASTKCCSEGISLVGASRVVLLDVVWNPSVERQAISRAYRLGQNKVVYTYHLMTSGTTEWDKYCRQAEKDRLSEMVFSASTKENDKQKEPAAAFNDEILEEMVAHTKLKDMFEKIIHQPKESSSIESFGLGSI